MIRTLGGHPATIDQLRRRARLRAWAAWQLDVPPDCETCGVDCGGKCEREQSFCSGCGARVTNPEARCLACVAGWVA
jgi:hypothetical protein